MSCVVLLLYEKKHKKQKMQINVFEGPGSVHVIKLSLRYLYPGRYICEHCPISERNFWSLRF